MSTFTRRSALGAASVMLGTPAVVGATPRPGVRGRGPDPLGEVFQGARRCILDGRTPGTSPRFDLGTCVGAHDERLLVPSGAVLRLSWTSSIRRAGLGR